MNMQLLGDYDKWMAHLRSISNGLKEYAASVKDPVPVESHRVQCELACEFINSVIAREKGHQIRKRLAQVGPESSASFLASLDEQLEAIMAEFSRIISRSEKLLEALPKLSDEKTED